MVNYPYSRDISEYCKLNELLNSLSILVGDDYITNLERRIQVEANTNSFFLSGINTFIISFPSVKVNLGDVTDLLNCLCEKVKHYIIPNNIGALTQPCTPSLDMST
jgi:hypothetical protein